VDKLVRFQAVMRVGPLKTQPTQHSFIPVHRPEQPHRGSGVLQGRTQQRERCSRVDDSSVLHQGPHSVQVIDSADQRADGGVRKVVGVGYLVILAKAAAGRWNLGGCSYRVRHALTAPKIFTSCCCASAPSRSSS
jgi:hypothetical protein